MEALAYARMDVYSKTQTKIDAATIPQQSGGPFLVPTPVLSSIPSRHQDRTQHEDTINKEINKINEGKKCKFEYFSSLFARREWKRSENVEI
mmetsp:Transcript_6139/g.9377  ORF Transcript_6139/g.9377 Transcript_6139/m.9377 type:complete len:92 (+) Transcript_6139:491-766(+)